MKTSYEQFKEDLEKKNNEILIVLWVCIFAIWPWLLLIPLAFAPLALVGYFMNKSKAKRHNKELERKRKMGYDV